MSAFGMMNAFKCLTSRKIRMINDLRGVRHFSNSIAMSGKYINYQVKNNVAVLTLDTPNSKVNVLATGMVSEFREVCDRMLNDDNVKAAVMISAKPECFVAGADINMLSKCNTEEDFMKILKAGHETANYIEASPKPIVAAIMGSCLGGGLELALACHYRIATNTKKTVLGLPEVMLGLLPGMGGTQRLPRLVSIPNAMDMMLTGKTIRADKAKKMGFIDHVVDHIGPGINTPDIRTRDYLEEIAIDIALKLADKSLKRPQRKLTIVDKILNTVLSTGFGRDFLFENQIRAKVMKMSGGLYPAPLKIIDVVKASIPQLKSFDKEAKAFSELGVTSESAALIGLFNGQTNCKKNHYPKPKKSPKNLAVLGAGLMGAGVAQVSIDKGYNCILKDTAQEGLARGQTQIENNLTKLVKKKKISNFDKAKIISNLNPSLDYNGFDKVDMVIEAVFEDIKIKHKVIKEVEKHIRPDCIFASNTSALPIGDIAAGSSRPENVIGMHYFSPVDKMQLLEIITTDKTSKDTVAAAVEVGLKQGKSVIVVKDGPGFFTTRCLSVFILECMNLMQEGMSPTELDRLTKSFGFPIGAATLTDEVGIDVGAHIAAFLGPQLQGRAGDETGKDFINSFVEKGFLGRKSGKGFFLYDSKTKGTRPENPEIKAIIQRFSQTPALPHTIENVRMRLLTKYVNENVMCLQEGILDNPLDGDIGMVFGLGFPPNLGGPFRYCDTVGAATIVKQMEILTNAYGPKFKPCQLLLDHAKDSSKKFHK